MIGPDRLLLVSQDFPPVEGGIQEYASSVASSLNRLTRVSVVAPFTRGAGRFDSSRPYTVYRALSPGTSLFGASACLAVPSAARKVGARIALHAQYGSAVGALLAKRLGILTDYFIAAHARELVRVHLGRAQRAWRREILRQASKVFAVSRYTAGLVADLGIPGERIRVVHNGVDSSRFFPRRRRASLEEIGLTRWEENKIIATVARLVPRKGIDTALEAFDQISRERDDCRYVVVGDGPQRGNLEQRYRHLIEADRVAFAGRVDREILPYYHSAADLFVMASRDVGNGDVEGFGLVFLEAGACNTAVIGTRHGGIPEAVDEGATGLLVDENAPADLARAMRRLLEEDALRERFARGGLERARGSSWDATASRIYDEISDAVRPRRGVTP
jgi:phosphatidyl-myo-inositol dimannoside synthase